MIIVKICIIFLFLLFPYFSLRFWFRLYWFPLKVLYATCVSSLQSVPNIPFYFFFNTLLLALLLMNIYWFLVSKHTETQSPRGLQFSKHVWTVNVFCH